VGPSAPIAMEAAISGTAPIRGGELESPIRWDWRGARARCLREAQRFLRDPLAAEDAVQEALLRAWRQRETCRQPDAPLGWMVQITRNEALRRLGRDRRRADHELIDAEGHNDRSPWEPDRRIEVLDLRRALADISAEERALLTLRYGADLTQPDIAEMLDVPEGTVKVRLFRARKRIRQAMETPAEAR
jgi:RNA polymerase sigma-70 factor (ECF subfamily)